MRWLSLVAASAALVSMPVEARTPKFYFCDVMNFYELSDAGAVQPISVPLGRKKGDHFQIDIRTGEMTGAFSSDTWTVTSVIDNGTSPAGSFVKVIYSSPPGREFVNVGYLEIRGTIDQQSRPFLYKDGPSLYSGVCHAAF